MDSQVLFLSIELWLLWMQPWNLTTSSTTTSSTNIPSTATTSVPTSHPSYDHSWIAYVASNLHFYTTLLSCYLSMVSRLTLSVSDRVGAMHLTYLEKTLNVSVCREGIYV